MKSKKTDLTIYSEPIYFGYPAVATGSILVWIPRYLFKRKYRKERTRYVQMPVVMVSWVSRKLVCTGMAWQSLQ